MGVVNSVQSAFNGPGTTDVKQQSIATTSTAPVTPTTGSAVAAVAANKPSAAPDAAPAEPVVTKTATVERSPSVPLSSVATKAVPAARNAGASRSPRVVQATSLEVVHLHRLGNCRGRLDVSADGIAFVSEKEKDADSFALTFAEFLHALSDDTLTLKSATKTYRFKAFAEGGNGTRQLHELADRISRARR
jgi:hypothetical protein